MPVSATLQAPTATLASAALPARVRDILQALNSLLWQALDMPLQATLDELEQDLLEQAGRARNGQVQQDLFQEAQRLRAQRGRFAPHYQAQLEAGLAGIRSPAAAAATPHTARPVAAAQMLTLVADVDIDRDIVLHEIARREATRCNIPLQLLGQRFGVLAARPAFEIEQLPLGPHALCRLLRAAGETLGLGLDTQLSLYRAFERQALARYGEIVERANVLLTHAGVLPGLIYLPYVARSTNVEPGVRRTARMAAGTAPAPADSPPRGGAAPVQAAPSMGMPPGPAATAPLPPAGAAAAAADPAVGGPDLATLRQLLTAARAKTTPAAAAPATAGAATLPARPASATGAIPVPTASLLQALGELQAQPPAHSTLGGLRGRRHLRDVQTALLQALRATHGAQATLAAQQADTFDLLGLLYGEIEREVRPDAPAAALLERLQVPLVRAALQDPAFFARSRHPARELLNAVAESGATWLGEEDSDPTLLLKLNQAVDRVVEEYEGDETVFEQAHQEIQAQQRSLAHKAEIAERRHVEAARGKERLELAKQTATATLEALCNARQPPGFVQTLLQQAWSDVLVLTLLRQGEDSETWRERIGLAERIAEVTCRSEGVSDAGLAERVGQALLQVGYHQQEAEAIARRLSTPGGTDATTSRTELSVRLKARTRLGEQGEDGERPSLPPRNEAEQAAYARLRTLPFGTWFEFVVNQQGDLKRQRLSWYSPITERALFVNQRGQKTAEHTLDGLARLLAQGQARIVSEDRARLIDRAWQAAVRALRTLAGVPAADDAMEGA
ncbi:DUF1631 domain-containing protein [Xanthomonas sp. A2111]|uniref:DUF1631 domain-containing protein n=1 Tax=Xanthomonas hawaiiensis TaxID=3003247 RepID=A0ABU2I1X9_9XANT|nr:MULTISPECIES: DUF1631 domain-containing protein [unclassified Xanthomonas]MBO9828652.1 DUF1631 domain-containing protein [Xanthomonas sp. A2111]MBO9873831.1 DUF1631 domain-containing protein [Xanthomonas sp. D-93]MDS9992155.1 DUF1631 domain-containing protein [Xanthomonas sp. A2111]WNH43952.1 DUF1631 domain-containing protein [Xanthomonas sp. A6251]